MEKATRKAYSQKGCVKGLHIQKRKAYNQFWMTPSHRFTRFWALKGRKGGVTLISLRSALTQWYESAIHWRDAYMCCNSLGRSTSFYVFSNHFSARKPKYKMNKKGDWIEGEINRFSIPVNILVWTVWMLFLWIMILKKSIRVEFQIFIFLHMFFFYK